jgi:hypothetical protein
VATLAAINKAERVLMNKYDGMQRKGPHGMTIVPGRGVSFGKAARELRKRVREGNYSDAE